MSFLFLQTDLLKAIPQIPLEGATPFLIGLFVLFAVAESRRRNQELENQRLINKAYADERQRNTILSDRAQNNAEGQIEAITAIKNKEVEIAKLQHQLNEAQGEARDLRKKLDVALKERDLAYQQSNATLKASGKTREVSRATVKVLNEKVQQLASELEKRDTIIEIYIKGDKPDETLLQALRSLDDLNSLPTSDNGGER